MKHAQLLFHLSFPVLFSLVGLLLALRREPVSGELVHLAWGVFLRIAAGGGPVRLGPRDPSGLPYQWFLYWPLAGILLLVVVGGWLFTGRQHART